MFSFVAFCTSSLEIHTSSTMAAVSLSHRCCPPYNIYIHLPDQQRVCVRQWAVLLVLLALNNACIPSKYHNLSYFDMFIVFTVHKVKS